MRNIYIHRDIVLADINTRLRVGQGETFTMSLQITNQDTNTPIDITDYTFSGQVRENFTTETISADFTIAKDIPFDSGSISVEIPSTTTAQLSSRYYVYEIDMIDASDPPIVNRLLEGEFIVRGGVQQ